MKIFMVIVVLLTVLSVITCNGQPNTVSTVQVGIVDPQPGKLYKLFVEIKNDSATSRLTDGMDFMNPNVSDLEKSITNWTTIGDTLFGTFTVPDQTYIRYAIGGLVQVNGETLKYSEMAVSDWIKLDMIEPNAAGFIFRRKK